MIAYRIVCGTLCQGAMGPWGIQSGAIEVEYPTSWRAWLTGNNRSSTFARDQDCTLDVDLEGGGHVRGACSVVNLDSDEVQVEYHGAPADFVEPISSEPE